MPELISSTKPGLDIAAKEIIANQQTGSFTCVQTGGTYQNVGNGFSITITKTGQYKITAKFQAYIDHSTNNSNGIYYRLAVNGNLIPGTADRAYKNIVTSGSMGFPCIAKSPITTFTAGDVITLQAYKINTDACYIYYASPAYIGYIQAEMVTAYVPVVSDTWFSYVPTIGATTTAPTKGTVNTDIAHYRLREGKMLEIMYRYYQTAAGTAGSGYYQWSLPPGFTADNARIPYSTYNYMCVCGHGMCYSSATPEVMMLATMATATQWQMMRQTTSLAWIGSTQYHLNYVTLIYSIHLQIPVL